MDDDRQPADVFRALANTDRRDILNVLRDAVNGVAPCIADIANRVELTRFATARHLRILETAGLVTSRRKDMSVIFTLRAEGLLDVDDWVGSFFELTPAEPRSA